MNLLSERLRWAMQQCSARSGNEIKPADVARAAEVSNATLNYWLNGVNGISGAKARQVAAYLGVDALWLETGKGDAVKPQERSEAPRAPLVKREARMILAYEDEEQLLDHYRRATERGREEIRAVAADEAGAATDSVRHQL